MQSSLRVLSWLAVVAASVAVGYYLNTALHVGGPAPGPKAPAKYAFVAGGSDPYWDLCVAGAEEAGRQLGASVDVMRPSGEGEAGVKEQLDFLVSLKADQYGGVAIGPIDPTRTSSLINSLADKSTVVTVDSDVPISRRAFYVGSDNYEAGEIAGRMVRKARPGGGDVVVLLKGLTKTNAVERLQGITAVLESGSGDRDYSVVGTYMDGGDFERCKGNVRRAVEEHSGLTAIVGTFGYHGPLVLEALADLGKEGAVAVVAFDEDDRVLDGIEGGQVYATIVQDPYMFGYEAVRMLDRVRTDPNFTMPSSGRVDVGVHCLPVTKETLESFRARLADRLSKLTKSDSES